MTFAEWLETQVESDDIIGDVAKDAKRDSRPKPANTLKAWRNHLAAAGACGEAKGALIEAWDEYECSSAIN